MIITSQSNKTDTFLLERLEEFTFWGQVYDLGADIDSRMDALDSIRIVQSFEIVSASGKRNKNDLKVLEEWELIYPEGNGSLGIVYKSIYDSDLE